MTYDELKNATSEMESVFYQSKRLAKAATSLVCGQLQNFEIDPYVLNRFKRELKNWDSVRSKWKTPR